MPTVNAREASVSPSSGYPITRASSSRQDQSQGSSNLGPSKKYRHMDTNNDTTIVQDFFDETGCPVYSDEKHLPNEIAEIILVPSIVELDKICVRVPPSCPGIGDWVFVVSLEDMDPDDISIDELGKWGRASGNRVFYAKTEEGKLPFKRVGKGKAPDVQWDYCLRCNSYNHPGTDGISIFRKFTYLAFNRENEILGPYGVIAYNAEVHPTTLKHLPHGLSKTNTEPHIRTKKSTLKRAVALLSSSTPREAHEMLMSDASLNADLSELPRNVKQLNALAYRSNAPKFIRRKAPPTSTPANYNSEFLTSPPRFTSMNVQNEVLEAQKREAEAGTRRHEVETEKAEYELLLLKTKKYKLDLEIARMKSEMDPNVVESVIFEGESTVNIDESE